MATDTIRFYRRLLDLLKEKEVSDLAILIVMNSLESSVRSLPDIEQKYSKLLEARRALMKDLMEVLRAEEKTSEKTSQEKGEDQDPEPHSEPRASEETV